MSSPAEFFASHPQIKRRMADSEAFDRVKSQARVEIDGEVLYVVKGDVLGDEDELLVETVIRGANDQGSQHRAVYLELSEAQQQQILEWFHQ